LRLLRRAESSRLLNQIPSQGEDRVIWVVRQGTGKYLLVAKIQFQGRLAVFPIRRDGPGWGGTHTASRKTQGCHGSEPKKERQRRRTPTGLRSHRTNVLLWWQLGWNDVAGLKSRLANRRHVTPTENEFARLKAGSGTAANGPCFIEREICFCSERTELGRRTSFA